MPKKSFYKKDKMCNISLLFLQNNALFCLAIQPDKNSLLLFNRINKA